MSRGSLVGRLPGVPHLEVPASNERRVANAIGQLVTLASGVPGPHRKWTGRLVHEEGDRIVKIAATPFAGALVRAEARALALLHNDPRLAHLAPRCLGLTGTGQGAVLVQEHLAGARLGSSLEDHHVRFLLDLDAATCGRGVYTDRSALDDLGALEGIESVEWIELFTSLEARLTEQDDYPTSFAHGDFAPWNLVLKGDRICAFDWEYARKEAPALFDLFHFQVQAGVLLQHRAGGSIFDEILASANGQARPLIQAVVGSHDELLVLLGHYALTSAVADAKRHALSPPEYAQADWMREARMEIARRVLSELRSVCFGGRVAA